MKILILFFVAIVLVGSNLRSIAKQNIEGQDIPIPQQTQQAKEKAEEGTEEESKVNVEEITNYINRHNSSLQYWNDHVSGIEDAPWEPPWWGIEDAPWCKGAKHIRKHQIEMSKRNY